MAVALNALGAGLISGVQAGTSIARNQREAEKWDMYKARQSEADATTAFATTLQDQYGGNMDSMLDSPAGQQIAFDYIKQNDNVKQALSSNRGWNPAGLVKGKDGNYFVMLKDQDGEHRPLTVDRASGTEPLRLSKQDLYTMMGASAAKLGVLNNPQMMKFLQETTDPQVFSQMKTFMGGNTADADNKIPSAPSIENVSKVSRTNASTQRKPEQVYSKTDQMIPDGSEGKDPAVDIRYNKNLSDAVEGGVSVKDLPKGVQDDIKKQSRNAEIDLASLSPADRQKLIGDEANNSTPKPSDPIPLGAPVSRPTTAADATVATRADVDRRRAEYNSRVTALEEERSRSGNNWTDDEIQEAATADVTPDDLRLARRTNQQTTAQGNTSFLDTAMGWLNTIGGVYNRAMDTPAPQGQERTFAQGVGAGARRVYDLASGYLGSTGEAVGQIGEGLSNIGGQLAEGFTGNDQQTAPQEAPQNAPQTPQQPTDSVTRTVAQKAVRESDAVDPVKRENVETGIGNSIRQETPQQRVAADAEAVAQLQRNTRKPTARQRYAAMRLYMSSALPAQAYTNYLQNGRFEGSDLDDAIKVINARTNQVKAVTGAQKVANTGRTTTRQAQADARKVYEDNLDTASTVVAADLSSRAGELMRAINQKGSGLNAKEFAKAALDTAMSSPDNVYLVSGGRTSRKEDLKDFEVQALTRMVSDKISQWTQGRPSGWFSRSRPSQKAMLDEINLRNLSVGSEQ